MHNPRGVYCANLTPFEPNGGPPATAAFVEHGLRLLANGCDGLSIFGTTGEANSMTVRERIDLMQALVEAGVDPQLILPGVGCTAIGDTVQLAKYALDLGMTDLLMLPPFYYKGVDDEGLYAAYAQTLEQIADERVRLYFYNIPAMSGISISPELIRRVQANYPKLVAGVKDTSMSAEVLSELLIGDPPFAGIVNEIERSEVNPHEGDNAGCYHRGDLSCSTRPHAFINCAFSFHSKKILLLQLGRDGLSPARNRTISRPVPPLTSAPSVPRNRAGRACAGLTP